jgi:hypothetical protein
MERGEGPVNTMITAPSLRTTAGKPDT